MKIILCLQNLLWNTGCCRMMQVWHFSQVCRCGVAGICPHSMNKKANQYHKSCSCLKSKKPLHWILKKLLPEKTALPWVLLVITINNDISASFHCEKFLWFVCYCGSWLTLLIDLAKWRTVVPNHWKLEAKLQEDVKKYFALVVCVPLWLLHMQLNSCRHQLKFPTEPSLCNVRELHLLIVFQDLYFLTFMTI